MQLADPEAKAYAAAVAKVNEQYSTAWNPKIAAWAQLTMVMGSIYGTRFYAIRRRQQDTPAATGGPGPQKVVDIKAQQQQAKPAAQNEARTPADLYGLGYSASIASEL